MAIKEMRKICIEIREKWGVSKIAMLHRTGLCPIGEVGRSSQHPQLSPQIAWLCLQRGCAFATVPDRRYPIQWACPPSELKRA
jgi:hypothetical protein